MGATAACAHPAGAAQSTLCRRIRVWPHAHTPPARRRHQRHQGRQSGMAVRHAGHAPGLHRLGTVRGQSAAACRQCPRLRWRAAVRAGARGTGVAPRSRAVWLVRRAHGCALQPGAWRHGPDLCLSGDRGAPRRQGLPNGSRQGRRCGGRRAADRDDDADDPGGHPGGSARA